MQINYSILFSFLFLNGILAEKDSATSKKLSSSFNSNKSPSKRSSYYQHNGLSADAYNYAYQIPYANAARYASDFHRPLTFGSHYNSGFGLPHHHLHSAASPVNFAAHSHVPAIGSVAAVVPAPTQYAIRPGGAVVQSYQVNYPQYHHHKTYPFAVAPQPIIPAAPAPAPVHISSQFIPQHFHYDTVPANFPSAGFSSPIAPIVPTPVPINPFNYFIPNRPGVQFSQIPDQRPIFVSFQSPTPVTPIQPTFIAPTPTTSVLQIAGTGLDSGQIPAQIIPTRPAPPQSPWRPLFVNQPSPTNPTPQVPSGNHPAVSLLPPYQPPVEEYDYDGQQQYYHHSASNNNQNNVESSDNNYFSSTDGYHY